MIFAGKRDIVAGPPLSFKKQIESFCLLFHALVIYCPSSHWFINLLWAFFGDSLLRSFLATRFIYDCGLELKNVRHEGYKKDQGTIYSAGVPLVLACGLIKMHSKLLAVALYSGFAVAAPLAGPTVKLDSATVTGTTLLGVDRFLGIPFAEPPCVPGSCDKRMISLTLLTNASSTGTNRFRLPVPVPEYTTSFSALTMGPACPQQAVKLPLPDSIPTDIANFVVDTAFGVIFPDDEDCACILF